MEAAEAESGIEVPMEDKVAAVAKEKAQKAGMWMKGQARWPAAETDTRHALGATLPHRPVTAGPATWPVLPPSRTLQAVSPPATLPLQHTPPPPTVPDDQQRVAYPPRPPLHSPPPAHLQGDKLKMYLVEKVFRRVVLWTSLF